MTFLSSGDHIVASTDVYGGTYGLLTEEMPRFGIEVSMADMTDPSSRNTTFCVLLTILLLHHGAVSH